MALGDQRITKMIVRSSPSLTNPIQVVVFVKTMATGAITGWTYNYPSLPTPSELKDAIETDSPDVDLSAIP